MSTASTAQSSLARPQADEQRAVITVRGAEVVFRRKSGQRVSAVKDLDLTVLGGTVFCLLGPNGSGKTTTINLLNGLLRPTNGEVRVLGLRPAHERRELLGRIAVVPQETTLYEELTGRENLEFHASYYGVQPAEQDSRVVHVLKLVGLSDAADSRVATYSGGMQRRLSLARALLTEPEVFFLDEPTLGVDVQSREAIWEHIVGIADSGRTVFLTTNYMEEAERLGRHMLIIDEGRPVVAGRPSELKEAVRQRRLEIGFTANVAARALERLVGTFDAEREGDTVLVEMSKDSSHVETVRAVLEALGDLGTGVTDLHWSEPSLQDVFLHYTGRSLRN
jgi:ABC-2 type transport system ATP-binding protein